MSDGVIYIITITLLIALGCLAFWIVQQSMGGAGPKIFQKKARRTGVVEATSVDGRRRLLLVRRDNVEHLIMTGGPVDVVIETGIPARAGLLNGAGNTLARENGLDGARSPYEMDDEALEIRQDQAN
jgi:hypothetical protein